MSRDAVEQLETRVLMSTTTTVFADGFEGDYLSGWTNRTDGGANGATRWGLNTTRAAHGSQSAFASATQGGVTAGAGYQGDQRNSLVREDVSLAGLRVATLAFDYFLNTESGYDTFSVAVTDAGGVRTTLLTESGNHAAEGWRHKTLDLSAFAGRRDLDIEFRFVSDASVANEGGGVWVDEARLTGTSEAAPGSIAGRLFDDADGDRARDAGERPLGGWVVYLDHNRNGARDAGEPARTTDRRGNYAFANLSPGTYYVAEEVPAGYVQTSPGVSGASSGSAFKIDVVFPDTTLTTRQRAAFAEAAARWAQVIVGDLPDANDHGTAIDDVRIVATAPDLDGRGGLLGQAAPTGFRPGSSLPYKGFMEFDAADLARLESDGQLTDVILHEMGHVLGFGTIWGARGLVQGAGTADPRFVGANATAQYNALFGTTAGSVPLESGGGPGTADTHWRDSTFGNELMTGFLNLRGNPLSRVTIGAMADLGYTVSYSAADYYSGTGAASSTAGTNDGEAILLGYAHTVFVDAGQARTGIDFGNRRANRAPSVGAVSDSPDGAAAGATVTLAASGVTDPDGRVAKVSFYRETNGTPGLQAGGAGGDALVGSDADGSDGFKATFSTAGLAARAYTYYAQATDDRGATSAAGTAAPSAENTVRSVGAGGGSGSIAGTVFNDLNGNAARDAGEPGQPGWRVFIDANRNGKLDAGERSVLTNSNGYYRFGGLGAGTYAIREVDQTGWARTAWSPTVTLAAGATATGRNFANFRSATAKGRVYNDADRDGALDAGEGGVAGVRVYDDRNHNGVLDSGERSTTTDARGNYTLAGLTNGNRVIRVVTPGGRRLTAPSAGLHRFRPTSGQTVTGRHFGTRPAADVAVVAAPVAPSLVGATI